MGVVLASAAFVATYGLSATLSHQVSDAFDALRATEISVTRPPLPASPLGASDPCPREAVENVTRLAGVTSAGAYQYVRDRPVGRLPADSDEIAVPVVGIDPGSLAVLLPHLTAGRLPDHGHSTRGDAVALIPQRLVERLGLPGIGTAILVAGRPVTVIGVFDDLERRPDALDAVLLPHTALDRIVGGSVSVTDIECGVVISTQPGAASPLSRQVALALNPQDPAELKVIAPPDPNRFRRQLETPVRTLTLALTGSALLIGIVAMSTSASSSVASRVSEIGLRKAIGARPRHILLQLLAESAGLGLAGAVVGAYLGSLVVVAVSLTNRWSPIIDLRAAVLACAAGSVVGAVAGLLPAIRAARIPAVESLRR